MTCDGKRCVYGNNQLVEVICQLRFPEIPAIQKDMPATFQEAIRQDYPQYFQRQDIAPPRISGTPGQFRVENSPSSVNHQFSSKDGKWRINLSSNFISLSSRCYSSWEGFTRKLDLPLVSFIQQYSPLCFERVGLRYINAISRNDLGLSGMPFRALITPKYLGILSDPAIPESSTTKCSVDTQYQISSSCHAKIHAGPGHLKQNGVDDGEVKFIYDLDLFMTGNIPVHYSVGALETIHAHAYPIFRNAITDTLHKAMAPKIF